MSHRQVAWAPRPCELKDAVRSHGRGGHATSILAATLLLLLMASSPARAFSPYELYLQSGELTQVGLVATLRPGQEEALAAAMAKLEEHPVGAKLAERQIFSPRAFTRTIEGRPCVVIHFAMGGVHDASDYLGAAEMFEQATESLGWQQIVEPHPRAKRYGRQWLQMEWINYIRGVEAGEQAELFSEQALPVVG